MLIFLGLLQMTDLSRSWFKFPLVIWADQSDDSREWWKSFPRRPLGHEAHAKGQSHDKETSSQPSPNKGTSRMCYSDVFEGQREAQGQGLWRPKTKKSTSAEVLALSGLPSTGSHPGEHARPLPSTVHSATPPKSPFIMNWIIWRIPNTHHERDELSCKSVTRQAQTKNVPVSQGNLHTILISSTLATKDRKWVRGHQCIRRGKGGRDMRGHQFECGHSWRSILNTNVRASFKAQKQFLTVLNRDLDVQNSYLIPNMEILCHVTGLGHLSSVISKQSRQTSQTILLLKASRVLDNLLRYRGLGRYTTFIIDKKFS